MLRAESADTRTRPHAAPRVRSPLVRFATDSGQVRRRTGEVILAHANALGCDLLIKGAYTQSRLRQMIFGGTTRYILSNAQLPVLMAH
jgi:nucleotide-binding universal stress UspA family protein